MKMISFLLFAAFMQANAKSYSQTVTLLLKNAPLAAVFTEIKNQTGYSFVYTHEDLQKANNIDIDVNHSPIDEVLRICFKDQPLTYTIVEKLVVIKEKNETPTLREMSGVPAVEIKGRVTNTQGVPLVSANVIIKRTGRGTQTNVKGEFILTTANPGDVITVSYTGYKSQSIKIGNNTDFTFAMEIATNELDKVVVQAYGTTTQRFNTGNIATVTAAEIERQPIMNPIQAIQGKVPGVILTQNSGYASSPVKIEIRGRSGLNPNLPSEPLYIVDGVPLTVLNLSGANYEGGASGFIQGGIGSPAFGQSPFFSINPQDIESITVLKDADATAIYGSRGANGVIILTTKKGKPGKTKMEFNIYHGVSKVMRYYDLLNTQQYVAMRREAFKNDGIIPDDANAYDLLIWDTTRYTDWQRSLIGGMGKTTDIETNISGGDKITTFRISGGYHRETSIMNNTSGADQRASLQFNLSHKSLNQKLNISLTSSYSYAQSDLIEVSGSPTLAPNAPPIYDSKGNLNFMGWIPVSDQYPFSKILQPYTAKTTFLNSQLTLQYELVKGVSFSTNLGYSTNHVDQTAFQPIASQNPAFNPTGSSLFGNNNATRAIIEPELEYKGLIARGKIDAMIGGTYQGISQDGNTLVGQGYVNDHLIHSIANAPTTFASDAFAQYKYAAIFGRITYNWDNKYIINLSARRDGSSKFGPGKQYGNFGAIGVAWIFTEERWFKEHLPILSFGKLRSSYGLTGDDGIDNYLYLTQWSGTNIPYQPGVPAYVPLLHANPNLQWQTNKKLEVAINLGFLKDRFNVEVAWYKNLCGNQLVPFPLSIITGFGQVTANYPAVVQNIGWETTLRGKLIDKKDLEWSVNLNFGINHNKLLDYPNLSQSPYAYFYVIGEPLTRKRVLHYTGVNPMTGKYTFQDKNKDGQITTDIGPNDDYYWKDLNIKLDGGFSTDLRFKNWQLNLFFTVRKQESTSPIFTGIPGVIGMNQSTQVLDRWQKPGDIANFAKFTTQPDNSYTNFTNSDAMYVDGSYIKLRNLSLSYDVPSSLTKSAHIQNCKIYLRGENLFILTKYNGLDPDTQALNALPNAKIFTGGIQFNF